MFDGVVIAPCRVLGSPRNTNPINEQGFLPLSTRPVVLQDRFPDLIGKKSELGPRHIHDTAIITNHNLSQMTKDTRKQMADLITDRFNLVSMPFTTPGPVFSGPVVDF